MSPLQKAIENEDLTSVRRLLTESPNLIDECIGPKHTPLALHAAYVSSFEILRYIVEYSRASLDICDDDRRNILHYGAMSGDPERCRYLVERCGMDPLTGDKDLVTPYEISWDLARGGTGKELYAWFLDKIGCPYEEMYKNPIRTGFFPDPSILAHGDDFYMVNSSFIYFPCIPISNSTDLVHWEIIGWAITNPDWALLDELEGGRGYWAPDISYDNGRFYITATYRLNDTGTVYRRQMVVSSDRPEGPYSKPVFINEDGIDPSLFHEDGKHYMLLNRGARLFRLSDDCTEQVSEAKLLYYGSQKHAPEGSHLLKKDGWYYLFQAEGGTGPGHRITVARSRELFGVYTPCPYNPIMRQNDPEAGIQRCGHGKPVRTNDGRWYMVYLCGRTLDGKYSILGRETALDPITWTPDGWPLVNGLKGPSVLQIPPFRRTGAADTLPTDSSCMRPVPDSCDQMMAISEAIMEQEPVPDPCGWMTPRPPQADAVRWQENGTVLLLSSPAPLSSSDARNIFLRRQTRFDFTAQADLILPVLAPGQEAGLICYYDENTWISCTAAGREHGSFAFLVKEHIGKETTVLGGDSEWEPSDISASALSEARTDIPESAFSEARTNILESGLRLRFTVTVRKLRRHFTVEELSVVPGQDPQASRVLFKADCPNVYYLCDEGIRMGKRFTGAMIGVCGTGGNEQFRYLLEQYRECC